MGAPIAHLKSKMSRWQSVLRPLFPKSKKSITDSPLVQLCNSLRIKVTTPILSSLLVGAETGRWCLLSTLLEMAHKYLADK